MHQRLLALERRELWVLLDFPLGELRGHLHPSMPA